LRQTGQLEGGLQIEGHEAKPTEGRFMSGGLRRHGVCRYVDPGL
jgi:hypothetical protein